jgi:hypothetical protein
MSILRIIYTLFGIILFPCLLDAQGSGADTSKSTLQDEVVDSEKSVWSFSASAYYYTIPTEKNFISLIGTADHRSLHLETRYNYEDLQTGSVFAGWKVEAGEKFQFGFTPMAGIVFGKMNGVAPGLELDAAFSILDFYSETEYVADFAHQENNFLYTWGELGVNPFGSFRTGISYQRTKLYQTGFDIQRGIFAEYSYWKLKAAAYYFNPFSAGNFVIASLGLEF